MARSKRPDRFVCIEDRGGGALRYRVHFVRGGRRVAVAVGSSEEAEALAGKVKAATAHLSTPTVEAALELYFADMLRRGRWREGAKAVASKKWGLRTIFAPIGDATIGAVTSAQMDRCFRAWDTPSRSAQGTRHYARVRAKAFLAWCIASKLAKASPMDETHAVPAPRTQLGRLRLDDARRLRAVVDPAAASGDPSAVFVLAALLLGARTSELTSMTRLSLDDGGRVASFVDAKDPRKVHVVRLPKVLVEPMAILAEQAGDGPLMRPTGRSPRAWGASAVRRWAGAAGLSMAGEMDARWLRRTKDTLAVEAGVSSEVVARETGHTLHVARQHYIQHGAETTGRAAAMDDATALVPNGTAISTNPRNVAK